MQRCTVPLYVYPCCDLISQQRVFRAHQANAAGQSWFAKWQPRRNPRLKGGEQAGRQAVDSIMRTFPGWFTQLNFPCAQSWVWGAGVRSLGVPFAGSQLALTAHRRHIRNSALRSNAVCGIFGRPGSNYAHARTKQAGSHPAQSPCPFSVLALLSLGHVCPRWLNSARGPWGDHDRRARPYVHGGAAFRPD